MPLTRILKMVCIGLAALIALQIARLATRKDPLADLKLPLAVAMQASPGAVAIQTTNAAPAVAPRQEPARSPETQARIDRVVQSEILGPVARPLPMALLGIAGKDAFLRAPNGQTGLVREGGELGGIKLLRIGTNRVLVEHEGQQKELIIFSGFGSETLLPKGNQK